MTITTSSMDTREKQDAVVDDAERRMLEFALRWVNSGGGPESEISTRFDMTGRAFHRKIVEILDRRPQDEYGAYGLSSVMVARIAAVARRRIWISS